MHRILLLLSFCFSFGLLVAQSDDCANPTALSAGDNLGTTLAATSTPADDIIPPAGSCSANTITVWYTVVVAPTDVGFILTLNTVGTAAAMTGDVSLTVLDACGGTPQPTDNVICDPLLSSESSVYKCLPAGNYLVQVACAPGEEGQFNLNYQTLFGPTATNTTCGVGMVPLSSAVQSQNNFCAPNDANVPICNGDQVNESVVWFEYTAGSDIAQLDLNINSWTTAGSMTATNVMVAAYDGLNNPCGYTLYDPNMPPECIQNTGTPVGSTLSYTCISQGDVIHFAIGSNEASEGQFNISVNETPGSFPPNDDCNVMAEDLNFNGLSMIAESNLCSTSDFGPNCALGNATHTVWYTYTVPANVKSIQLNLENWNLPGGGTASEVFAVALTDCTSGNYYQNNTALENCAAPSTNFLQIDCPVEGDVIFFSIGSDENNSGTFDISISEVGLPNAPICGWNETCDIVAAAPIILDNSFICEIQSVTGCNQDACPDPDQASLGCTQITDNPTTWHAITIPTNNPPITSMNVNISGALGDPVFSVFEGACSALTTAMLSDGMGGSAGPMPTCITTSNQDGIIVVEGTTYLIPISTNGSSGDNYSIDIELIAPPLNDLCQDAIALDQIGNQDNGSTFCASEDVDPGTCEGELQTNQVWYTYLAPADILHIDINLTSTSTTGAFFTTGIANQNDANCNTNPFNAEEEAFCQRDPSIVDFCVTEGETYYILVSSSENQAANFSIQIIETFEDDLQCTSNDDCNEAQDLTGAYVVDVPSCDFQDFPGCNIGACPNENVFTACGGDQNPVVWHTITAPLEAAQLIVQVDGMGSLANPILGVFQGGTPTDCNGPFNAAVAGSDCITGNMQPTDPINLNVGAGEQFLIAVGSEDVTGGNYTLQIQFIIPPENDNPCPTGIYPPVDLSGGASHNGSTCCSFGFNDAPLPNGFTDFQNQDCGTNLDDDSVWYTYTPQPGDLGVLINVSPGSISGNVAVEAYWGAPDAGCTGALTLAGAACGPLPLAEPLKFAVCSDPPETLYVKVSGQDINDNCGTFIIDIRPDNGCSAFADICDEIALNTALIAEPIDGGATVCISTCNRFACAENNDCDNQEGSSVWVQVNTDIGTSALIISIVDASFAHAITVLQGTDCSNLGALGMSCLPDQSNTVAVGPNTTYWIRVETTDGELDDDFQICIAAESMSFNCSTSSVIGTRPEHPGEPSAGPYCPGENVNFCFTTVFNVDGAGVGNGCQWLQGIVPVLGAGWDIPNSNIAAQPITNGGFWLPENTVTYNFENPRYTLIPLPSGALGLEYNTGGPPIQRDDFLPAGWWFISPGGGAACTNQPNDPNTQWGLMPPFTCGGQSTVQFCVDLRVKELADIGDCTDPNNPNRDLGFDIYVFADGETGCYTNVSCALTIPLEFDATVNCDLPEEVVGTDDQICNNGQVDILLSLINGGGDDIIVTAIDNPNVDGEMDHIFTGGSGTIDDILVNNSTTDQVVVYEAYSVIPGNPCDGPVTTFEVTIYSQIEVVDPMETVCLETDPTIAPNVPVNIVAGAINGSGNYTSFVWTPLNGAPSGFSLNLNGNNYQVTQSAIAGAGGPGIYEYNVTVTDDLGCTGEGIVTLTVFPEVETIFDGDPFVYCKNDQNQLPVIVPNTTTGTPGYNYQYDIMGFGLSGGNVGDGNFTVDLAGSFGGDPVIVDVLTTDDNGCTHETSFTVQILEPLDIATMVESNCGDNFATLDINVLLTTPNVGVDQVIVIDPNGGNLYQSNGDVHEDINLPIEGTYTITATNQLGVCPVEEEIMVTFKDIETPEMTPDQVICEGETLNLAVTNAGDYTGFLWNDPAGSTTASINVMPSMNTTYTVQVMNDQDCTTTASVEVTVNPNPTVNFSGATNFCPGTMTTISAGGDPTVNNYNWDGPGFTVDPTDASSINVTIAGTYEVTITDNNNCSVESSIEVMEGGVINTTIDGADICDNDVVELDAGAGFLTYLWQVDDGTGNFVDAPVPNTDQIYMTSVAGTYQVLITQGGCNGSGVITINQFNSPDVAVTPSVSICDRVNTLDSTFVDFNAQVTGANQSGVWADVDFAGVDLTTDLSNVDFLAAGVAPGSYDFTFTTNTAMAPCVDEVYTMTVQVLDCACPNLDTNDPAPMCSTGGPILILSSLEIPFVTSDGSWALVETPDDGMVNIPATDFNSLNQTAGEYIFEFTVDTPGGADCDVSQTDTVTVFDPPMATVQMTAQTCNVDSPIGGFVVDFNAQVQAGSDPGDWALINSPMGTAIDLATDLSNVSFENAPLGDYIFEYTTNNAIAPCQNESYTFTVTVVDCNCPINPLVDPLCNDSDMIDLSSLELPQAPAGIWTVTDGPAGHTATIMGTTFDATDNLAGQYIVTFTLTGAGLACDVPITVVEAPVLTVTPTGDACSNVDGDGPTSLDLTGYILTGDATGTDWTSDCGLDFSDPTNVSFVGVADGICTITYTTPDDPVCGTLTETIEISVSDCLCPNVDVGSIDPQCNQGSLAINLASIEAANADDGTWFFESGPQTISISNDFFDPNGLAAGEYVVYFQLNTPPADPDCQDTSQVTIVVDEPMTAGTPEAALPLCLDENDIVTLADLLTGEDAGGVWIETSIDGSTGTAFDPVAGTFNTSGQIAGTYTFAYTLADLGPCPDVEETVTVVIEGLPTADAGAAAEFTCTISDITIGGASSTGNTITYFWSEASGTPLTDNTNITFNATVAGTYILEVTDEATGCISTDSVVIGNNDDQPQITVDSSDPSCFGVSDGVINVVTVSGGDGNYEYSIDGGVTWQTSQQFSNLDGGSYVVTVQDGTGCANTDATELSSPVLFDVGMSVPSGILQLGEPSNLTIDPMGIDPADIVNMVVNENETSIYEGPFVSTLEIMPPLNQNVYSVTIFDSNDCSATALVNVQAIELIDIFVPNIFSPNGDSTNDRFTVFTDQDAIVDRFLVYDRWGELVYAGALFSTNDPTQGWDGLFKGEPVEQGVYVYVIDITFTDGQQETREGDVTILR